MRAQHAEVPPRGAPALSPAVGTAAAGLFAAAAILCHVVYFLYDRRGLIDHDLFYTAPFLPLLDRLRAGDPAGFLHLGLHLDYPLVNWLLALWTWVLGLSTFSYFLFAAPFVLALVLSAAWLGARRAGPLAGALCALAVATCPLLDNASRKYFVEFHATDLVFAANCLALYAAGRLERLTPALMAGIGGLLGASWLAHPGSVAQSAPAAALALWAAARARTRNRRRAVLLLCLALPVLPSLRWIAAHLGLRYFASAAARIGTAFPDGRLEEGTLAGWATDFLAVGDGPWLWVLPVGLAALVANLLRRPREAAAERAFLFASAALFAALSFRGFQMGQGLHLLLFHPLVLTLGLSEIVALAGSADRLRRWAPAGAAGALLALTALGFADKLQVWSAPPNADDLGTRRFDRRYVGHAAYFSNTMAERLAAEAGIAEGALRVEIEQPADTDAAGFLSTKSPCRHLAAALRLNGFRMEPTAARRWRVQAAFGQRLNWRGFAAREMAKDRAAGASGTQFLAGVDELGAFWLATVRADDADPPAGGFVCAERPADSSIRLLGLGRKAGRASLGALLAPPPDGAQP